MTAIDHSRNRTRRLRPLPPRDSDARVRVGAWLAREWAASLVGGIREWGRLGDLEAFVMFVGYPRSGHTLLGTMLNAHPEAVIAHELDALWFLRAGFSRRQLWALVLDQDRRLEARGGATRRSYRLTREPPDAARPLRVIGDKKGGTTLRRLRDSPELIDRLRERMRLPLRFVHVTRNPFDNIASIHRKRARRGERHSLRAAAERYFALAEAVPTLKALVPDEEWLELRHEDLVAHPRTVLGRLCRFVGLEPEEDYLRACAEIVRPQAHRSSMEETWSTGLIEEVRERSVELPLLADYVTRPVTSDPAATRDRG